MTRMTGPDCAVMCNLMNIHTCEWHRMTRMTGPDCAVMCNLIIYIHTYKHFVTSIIDLPLGGINESGIE